MKRLFVKCADGSSVNIGADRLKQLNEDTNYIVAIQGNEIVGVFDLGNVAALYLSESSERQSV